MSQTPLVSIIVPTKNSANTLGSCLKSIANQTYENIETIVVDNSSSDDTQAVAYEYTKHVYTRGPERSAQRNFGVSQSKGMYVIIIDSDMELTNNVVAECIGQFNKEPYAGLIIPEESFGSGFWAKCKKLERSFYVGVEWMEAARAFPRSLYLDLGGYNEKMVSGEDWDLSQRAKSIRMIGRIESFIMHNEGQLKLSTTLKKKYYYAQQIQIYFKLNSDQASIDNQTGPIKRYALFFKDPIKLFRNPLIGIGMLFLKTCEFAAGFAGIIKK